MTCRETRKKKWFTLGQKRALSGQGRLLRGGDIEPSLQGLDSLSEQLRWERTFQILEQHGKGTEA